MTAAERGTTSSSERHSLILWGGLSLALGRCASHTADYLGNPLQPPLPDWAAVLSKASSLRTSATLTILHPQPRLLSSGATTRSDRVTLPGAVDFLQTVSRGVLLVSHF